MNLYQSSANFFLGFEFVELEWVDGTKKTYRAFLLGGRYYVYPYGNKGRGGLLENGAVSPEGSVYSWKPLTSKVRGVYKLKEGADAKAKTAG